MSAYDNWDKCKCGANKPIFHALCEECERWRDREPKSLERRELFKQVAIAIIPCAFDAIESGFHDGGPEFVVSWAKGITDAILNALEEEDAINQKR